MKKNYVNENYCNFESFQMLTNKAKENFDDFQIIEDAIKDFASYIQDVNVGEQQMKRVCVQYDGEEVRYRIQEIDKRRTAWHNQAISSAQLLNRLAKLYKVPAIFTGNFSNRLQVADFCLDITVEIFQNRRM